MTNNKNDYQLPENFYLYHGLLPALLLAVILLLVAELHLDSIIATAIFNSEGQGWSLRGDYVLENVIHRGGRYFFAALYLPLLGLVFAPAVKSYRRPLGYLTLSIFISIISINLLKKISGIPCPWSVQSLGGSHAMIEWFNGFSGESGCFPAGHASSGYAWVALYFFALMLRPQLKYQALMFGLIMGLIYGVAQQLRGAHFVSHDIWTLAICWFVPMLLYPWFCSKVTPKPVAQPIASDRGPTTIIGEQQWN